MKRVRIATAVALVLTAGCSALISVPDLELGPFADAGTDGTTITTTITPTNDGSMVPTPDSATGTPDATVDAGPPVCAPTVNVQDDPANCGVCGHSCLKGVCTDGICSPSPLVTGLGATYGMDSDATYLYFTVYSPPTVWRVQKDGMAAGEILVNPGVDTVGVHIDGTTLYWSSNDGVESCDVTNGATSCAMTRIKIGPNQAMNDDLGPEDIKTYQGLVYWADEHGSIFRAQPDGGARVAIIKNLVEEEPFELAIGGGNIYITTLYGHGLVSALIDGGAEKDAGPDFSAFDDPYVVADDNGYFWSYTDDNSDTGMIFGGDHATHTPKSLGASVTLGSPRGVAVDATYIYWTDVGTINADTEDSNGNGRLLRCPRTGCVEDPTVLATGVHGGGPMAVDDKFVYLVEDNNENDSDDNKGLVSRVAKP